MAAGHTDDLEHLETRLGHRFADRNLLLEALTHRSAGRGRDNQRLEFLGDALLNAAVSLLLYRERPDWQEGPMSKLRGVLVRTESLHQWAMDLGLDRALRAVHPRKAPPMGPKPLADALEALLAALFLDVQASEGQGSTAVQTVVEARFLARAREAEAEGWARFDPKTALQEAAARLGLPAPAYEPVAQSGPGHAPRFTVRVTVGGTRAEATGPTRKGAEGEAAARLLDQLAPRTQA